MNGEDRVDRAQVVIAISEVRRGCLSLADESLRSCRTFRSSSDSMGRRGAGAALVLCVVMVLGACGDDEAVPDGTDGVGGVVDGDYIATAVTEGGEPRALIEGTTIRLRLDDGSLSARAGCNTIGGEFRIEDEVLRVDAVSMTEMGCGQALHDQDEWLAGFLSASPDPGDRR